MSARDFCSPLPAFADWSHSPTGGQAPPQWVVDKERKRLLEYLLQSVVAVEECDPITNEASETLLDRFHRLADEWSRNTMHISSASDLVNDRCYREIIDLGWDVVPYLLLDLQRNKRFWFPALAEITELRPFDKGDTSNPRRMTEAWIRWGKLKGYKLD